MHEKSPSWGEDCGKKSGTRKRPARGFRPIVNFRWMLTVARLKYILAVLFAANCFVSEFLTSLMPTVPYRIFWICLGCWIPLFFVFLGALFRRRWKGAAIVSTALMLAAFCFARPPSLEPLRFLVFRPGISHSCLPRQGLSV